MNYKLLTVCALMTSLVVSAQPAGIRVEVAEQESDNAEYSIFTYKDSNADSSFGYYLSVGRTKKFLGADEILGMEVKNLHEVTVWLGATTDEALTSIASLLALYKKEIEALYDNVLLIDAGDAIQGAAIGAISKGNEIIKIMNRLGYDVWVTGNHEYNYGMGRPEDRLCRYGHAGHLYQIRDQGYRERSG